MANGRRTAIDIVREAESANRQGREDPGEGIRRAQLATRMRSADIKAAMRDLFPGQLPEPVSTLSRDSSREEFVYRAGSVAVILRVATPYIGGGTKASCIVCAGKAHETEFAVPLIGEEIDAASLVERVGSTMSQKVRRSAS